MESKNKEIRCCLFDMGNVLVHFSHELMCDQIGQLCDQPGKQVHDLIIHSGLFEKMETGSLTEAEFHRDFQSLVQKEIPFEDLKRAASDIFELNEEILPILEELKQSGMRLIVLSNTGSSHIDFIRKNFQVLDYFDDFTLSYEVGALKPSEIIYRDAIEKSGFTPEECFYTDDILHYIEEARKLGIQAEQFQGADPLRKAMKTHGIPLK